MNTSTRLYFTKEALVEAHRESIMRYHFLDSQQVDLTSLPANGRYPVAFHMWNGSERNPAIRCQVVIDANGGTITLNVDLQVFNNLPHA